MPEAQLHQQHVIVEVDDGRPRLKHQHVLVEVSPMGEIKLHQQHVLVEVIEPYTGIEVTGVEFAGNGAEMGTPMRSDRSAWDVDYPHLHASDIDSDEHLYHMIPADEYGMVMTWDGSKYIPMLPPGAGEGAPADHDYVAGSPHAFLPNALVRPSLKKAPWLPGYNEPPASADALDDEFDDGAVHAKWSTVQGPLTLSESAVPGWLKISGLPANIVSGIVQPIPEGNFDVRAKLCLGYEAPMATTTNIGHVGLGIFDGTGNTDDAEAVGIRVIRGTTALAHGLRTAKFSNPSLNVAGTWAVPFSVEEHFGNEIFLRVVRVDTTYNWYVSMNGIGWTMTNSTAKVVVGTPSHIGIVVHDQLGGVLECYVDWMRRYS
jgi:hypothetical protein